MFENNRLRVALGLAALVISWSAAADDLELEACINGAVSPSGTHPSATLERRANGYQTWPDYAPYYLFAVSATYLDSPFGDDVDETSDTPATTGEGPAEPNRS